MVPRRRRPPPSVFIFPRFLHSSNPRFPHPRAKFPNHHRSSSPPPNPRTAPPRDSGSPFAAEMPPRRLSAKRRRCRATEAAAAEADALISLPPDVLDDILTRVGIRDAVRTSALSRAWRRRWEALSSLDLNFPSLGYDKVPLGAVDCILLRFPGSVRRFCANLDNAYAGRIHDWLRVLCRRGIEILDLRFGYGFALPSSVFSCSRLTSLTLTSCVIPLLPQGFVAFPELRRLTLVYVQLQEYGGYQLEEIIDTSPLLEYLSLISVLIRSDYVRKWVIRAPNLRHLVACSDYDDDGWILKKLTSLRCAEIAFTVFLVHRNFAKFLSGLVQVTELSVVTGYIPSSAKMPEILCKFHNLKILKLNVHFYKQHPIMLTLYLLKSAPNLEELKLKIYDEEELEFEANGEFLNALWADGMCANLQVVQMSGIHWLPNEMSFIKLILSKARGLHTLSISHSEEIVMSTEDALNELLRYRRASTEAQILFKGKTKDYY
ncbi:F-box/FBD/LRR-repeat protein At1g13570-like [Lolium perenne]|uniref:F-box/FBD/LRR-repeat protein At1g13570-like n=1 Tax=Lolium perenne TaxID=4522 RepID=UPI0021F67015|nr:F-box/FBD/LRR-repeat protein At1g13570-like [Lolium perenne]